RTRPTSFPLPASRRPRSPRADEGKSMLSTEAKVHARDALHDVPSSSGVSSSSGGSSSSGVSSSSAAPTAMRVRKRNGSHDPVDLNKIVRAVGRCCEGLPHVDALRVATRTIAGLYDGATTRELDQLSIQTAAALTVEEPEYARLAARLLATVISKEVAG